MSGRVYTFPVHVVEQGGEAFTLHAPAHVRQIFRRGFRAVKIGRAASVLHYFRERGVPDIRGDVAEFLCGFADEGAEGSSVRVLVHADPGGFARALEVARSGVAGGQFQIDQLRSGPEALGDAAPGVAGAEGRVEHPAGRGLVDVQAGGAARGHNDAFRPDQGKGRFIPRGVQRQRSGDFAVFRQQFNDGMMIEDTRPALARFSGQNGFLLCSVVLEGAADAPGKGMAGEFPVSGGAHGNAPCIPHLDDIKGFFKKASGQDGIVAQPELGEIENLVHDDPVIRAVFFRYPAAEMIIAGSSGAAAPRVGLFRHNDFRPPIC